MICPSCKRRLKADAIHCLCGWSAATHSSASRLCANAPHCKDVGAIGVYQYQGNLYCKTCRMGEESKAMRAEWISKGSPSAQESIANIRRLLKNPKVWTREDWIAHWKMIRADASKPLSAHILADEALKRIGPDLRTSVRKERTPGEDDGMPASLPADALEMEMQA